ncbi:MAG: hypothetical protein ACLTK0_02715 [Anaerovoracaceae bacterium]
MWMIYEKAEVTDSMPAFLSRTIDYVMSGGNYLDEDTVKANIFKI